MAVIEKVVYELPTEDTHKLEIVEVGEPKIYHTKFGDKLKFSVKIRVADQKAAANNADGTPKDINVFMSFGNSIGPKSTLVKFLKRLRLEAGVSFDTQDLTGIKFTATIAHNEGEGQNAGTTYANVVMDTVKPGWGRATPVAITETTEV